MAPDPLLTAFQDAAKNGQSLCSEDEWLDFKAAGHGGNGEDDLSKDPIFGGVPETARAQYVLQEAYEQTQVSTELEAEAAVGAEAFAEREELMALLAEQGGEAEDHRNEAGEALDAAALTIEALTAEVLLAANRAAAAAAAAESAAARRHVVLCVRPEDDETELPKVWMSSVFPTSFPHS